MPTNLYGPNDNFDLTSRPRAAGADPQVPRRQGTAARPGVEIWGTGSPMREFLHVDDLADACLHLMRALQRRQPHQRRHRRRPVDPRARREGPRPGLPRGASCGSTPRSPTARRARCSTSPVSPPPDGQPKIDLDTGIARDLPMVPRSSRQRTSTCAASTASPPRVPDRLYFTDQVILGGRTEAHSGWPFASLRPRRPTTVCPSQAAGSSESNCSFARRNIAKCPLISSPHDR